MKILAHTSKVYIVRILETIEDDQSLYDFLEYKDSAVMHEYPFIDIEVPSREISEVEGFLRGQGWLYRIF